MKEKCDFRVDCCIKNVIELKWNLEDKWIIEDQSKLQTT